MYNIEVAQEIYKRLLENCVNISLAGIPIVEEVLNEEDERRRTPRALDLRGASPLQALSTPELNLLAEVVKLPPTNQ